LKNDTLHTHQHDSIRPVRILAEIAVLSALYVAMTVLLAPVSYGPIQFRISEGLVILVAARRHLIMFVPIGCFIANLFSPYAGPWDLIFMPLVSMLGVLPMYILRKRWLLISSWAYALVTAVGVGLMLSVLTEKGFFILFGSVLGSQLIIMTLAFFAFRGYLMTTGKKEQRKETNISKERSSG